MKVGTLYGIGVGPGDPDLMTVRGARLLSQTPVVFAPTGRTSTDSTALAIAGPHVNPEARVIELVFPMTADSDELSRRWRESAERVTEVLKTGSDACFLTLGDPMLYSTWIYLAREVRPLLPEVEIVTVPGVPALCAVAALTGFELGTGNAPVTIVPASDDLDAVEGALGRGGTVVLMKVGRRLEAVIDLLERSGLLDDAVFVSRAGLPEQRVETDLRRLRGMGEETGYLSIVLVHAGAPRKSEALIP